MDAVNGFKKIKKGFSGMGAIQSSASQSPDVWVLSLLMPGMSGLTAAKKIKRRNSEAKIVIMADYINHFFAHQFFALHCPYIVSKQSPASELIETIKRCHTVEPSMKDIFGIKMVSLFKSNDPFRALTDAELDVILSQLHFNMSLEDIAKLSGKGVKTLYNHRGSAFRKLGIHKLSELYALAIKAGFSFRYE